MLKIKTKYVIFLYSILFFNFISISRWEQINTFSKADYQNVQLSVDITSNDLTDDQFYTKWNILFDNSTQIKIRSVKVNNNEAQYSFLNNQLKIEIGKLYNNQKANIKVVYDLECEDFLKNVSFIKRDLITIPECTKGTFAKVTVKIPKDYIVYNNCSFLKKNKKGDFEWQGKVQQQKKDEIYMCLKKASWDVTTTITLFSQNHINDLKLITNNLYLGGNNEVKNFKVLHNGLKTKYKKENDNVIIESNQTNSSFHKYEINAQINNTYGEYNMENYNQNDRKEGSDIYSDETLKFEDIVKQILKEDKSSRSNYMKICCWVNKYLQYDITMTGKKIGAESVFRKKKGVCEHYAILFKRLMEELKIPCFIVSGLAYSFNHKAFVPHAWNVIFVKDKWIPIDPTWNLYLGVVPISHIFTKVNLDEYNGLKAKVLFKNCNQRNNITMNIKQDARFIS